MPITLLSQSSTFFGGEAVFCNACVSGGIRYGDTCWAVTDATDNNRGCGCNSGGWAGTGIYYGGYKTSDMCGGQGGGFAGPKSNGQSKGNLPSIGLRILFERVTPCPENSVGTDVDSSGCACSPGFIGTILASDAAPFYSGSCVACPSETYDNGSVEACSPCRVCDAATRPRSSLHARCIPVHWGAFGPQRRTQSSCSVISNQQ